MTRPRYTGIASFMRAPIADTWDGIDIGLIGVPFDGGVTNRPGTRHGPRAVRDASSLIRIYNQATGVKPHELCTVKDLGDCIIEKPWALESALAAIETYFQRVHAAGIVPLTCGGDHAISLPILRAIAKDRPVALVQIDAHADTGDAYFGSRYHHGAPFRRAVEEGLLEPQRSVQIGIRGSLNDLDMWKFSTDVGMRLVQIEQAYELGVKGCIDLIREKVGNGPVYLSFDIDSLDPAYAPGTGTPEVGGFTTLEAQMILRGLRGMDLVGADMVEVSPPFDTGGITAMAGANILFEQLCLLAEARAARQSP